MKHIFYSVTLKQLCFDKPKKIKEDTMIRLICKENDGWI